MRVAHLKRRLALRHFPTQGVFNKGSLITTSTVAIAQVTAAENRGLDVCHPPEVDGSVNFTRSSIRC